MERKEHPRAHGTLPARCRHREPIAAEGLAGQGPSPSIFHCLLSRWPAALAESEWLCCWVEVSALLALQPLPWRWHSILTCSLLLEPVGAVIAPSSLGAWHHYGFALWPIGKLWGAVVSLPSPDFTPFPCGKPTSSFPQWNNWSKTRAEGVSGLCGGGHSAELEHKSWLFTAAAFLAAVPSYHKLYYIFISLPMLIPVFIPWCSACLCWQMTLSYIVFFPQGVPV